jgi:ADP-ribosylglycohydrolase
MNNLKKAVEGAILQDKYVLGLHWIYDTKKVAARFNEDAVAFDVVEDSFHKTKHKGDLTHYGDILMHFMSYLNEVEQPDVATYYESFVEWMKSYDGYKDHAMKQIVENIDEGHYRGSDSSEFAGLCKISPILLKYQDQPKLAKLYAIAFTKATHDHPLPITLATYFSDVVFNLQAGMIITEALDKALETMPMEIVDLYNKGKECLELEPVEAISKLGQACPASMAFPSVVYLLLKYQTNIKAMSSANVRAG